MKTELMIIPKTDYDIIIQQLKTLESAVNTMEEHLRSLRTFMKGLEPDSESTVIEHKSLGRLEK